VCTRRISWQYQCAPGPRIGPLDPCSCRSGRNLCPRQGILGKGHGAGVQQKSNTKKQHAWPIIRPSWPRSFSVSVEERAQRADRVVLCFGRPCMWCGVQSSNHKAMDCRIISTFGSIAQGAVPSKVYIYVCVKCRSGILLSPPAAASTRTGALCTFFHAWYISISGACLLHTPLPVNFCW
jgi:hypothetical protein